MTNSMHGVTTLNSEDTNYPSVATKQLPQTLNVGQTVTAYVLKTAGSNVKAKLYVANKTGDWWQIQPIGSGFTLVDNP